jgi:hypothetical protein
MSFGWIRGTGVTSSWFMMGQGALMSYNTNSLLIMLARIVRLSRLAGNTGFKSEPLIIVTQMILPGLAMANSVKFKYLQSATLALPYLLRSQGGMLGLG